MGIEKEIYFFGQTPMEGAVHIPLQTIHYINPHIQLDHYDFIIVTSKRSIDAMLFSGYKLEGKATVCIGEKTAQYARMKKMRVIHTSNGYAKSLKGAIEMLVESKKGLYLRPKKVANDEIAQMVTQNRLAQAICYETACLDTVSTKIRHPAVLLFAAPSQVRCFKKHFGFEKDDIAVAIGETTYEAIPSDVISYISEERSMEKLYELGSSKR